MMLNLNHKAKRDLLTGMDYVRNNSLITQRQYNYDALGRPVTRDTRYPNRAIHHADTFAYNKRSELTGALLDENAYTYAYDNIGNREIAQEVTEGITYAANNLNQYTRISTNGENFTPEYDADGNQILIQTSTGIWKVQYNGQNRAVRFESEDGRTVITCGYDYMGRRFEKKVVTNGTTALHERYIYRGYLQIAAYDLREGHAEHPDLRFIIWDPTQEVATRPLAIRENGVWYTYGWDLTKNICELYGQEGFIRTIYTYSPYGQVTAEGDVIQPIQWSSEMYDAELGLVYYNFRYYNPLDGRWTRRDCSEENNELNLYAVVGNATTNRIDQLGLLGFQYMQFESAIYEKSAMSIKNAMPKGNAIAAIAELIEGYEAMKEADIIGADKWFHCLYMCRSAREGKLPQFTLLLGLVREILEFIKGRFTPSTDSRTKKKLDAIEHFNDCLADMVANGTGVDCPKKLSCECCCAVYKVNGIE